jgi:hypothetical protein
LIIDDQAMGDDMGMRKKWSRTITVNGVKYRYHVAEDQFDGLGLHVCVQQVEPAGQRLLSGFRKPMSWNEVAPGHKLGQVLPNAVTPRVIRGIIVAGLEMGWKPTKTGLGSFHLPGHTVVAQLPKPA